ncbi:MAG: acyl-CoA thioesterase [Candidatus Scalindua sp.]|jgi:acyl-CoA thioester hydrolase|nr:acyl-CoA thioesterase [Candidatus Scalindua sp.]MBT5306490.1 acyl-CoA thioesterase [Candidatus Scalindua sp.]MBT6046571.1 acyl-CoA thioesterase [Candidatus Scalindua sp.]MBT6225556.1 acyl-CoA thioesterase [Candidatus Scalindua sp.]MBT6562244.1 acyl-CoA thioesterase [Candidatus Scalindua sp.]
MKCCEINTRVRYQETDQMGIVYYSNYFVYFEIGRIEFLRSLGISYAEIEKENVFLAVAEAHCKYKAPAMFDDLLVIKTCLSMMKLARIEFCYEIRRINEEKLIAEGSTLLACLGVNKKPMAIPEKIRDALS